MSKQLGSRPTRDRTRALEQRVTSLWTRGKRTERDDGRTERGDDDEDDDDVASDVENQGGVRAIGGE